MGSPDFMLILRLSVSKKALKRPCLSISFSLPVFSLKVYVARYQYELMSEAPTRTDQAFGRWTYDNCIVAKREAEIMKLQPRPGLSCKGFVVIDDV